MSLEGRSVENLLGTLVPYGCAVKAGPWLFLTGHEAYDWRTCLVDEAVSGPPGYPLFGHHHKSREQLPGQQRAGIENQKQKSVIPHLAARDRHAGEDAQSLDREGQPIAFMSAKSGDTALCHRASVYGGVAVGVECCARRQCFAGFGGKRRCRRFWRT